MFFLAKKNIILLEPDGWSWGTHRFARSKLVMMLVWKMAKHAF